MHTYIMSHEDIIAAGKTVSEAFSAEQELLLRLRVPITESCGEVKVRISFSSAPTARKKKQRHVYSSRPSSSSSVTEIRQSDGKVEC